MTAGDADVVATAARQGALGLVGAVLAGAGGLALTVVVSRMTSPDQAGIYFTMVAAFTIASTVSLLGADTGLVRALAGARAAGDQHLVRPYLRIAIRPVAAAAASAGALVLVAAVVLAARHDPRHERDLIISAGILAPFLVPATMSTLLLNGASRGLGSMRTFTAVQQILLPVSRPILVAGGLAATGAWAGSRTASTAVLAWAVPVAIAAVLAARAVVRMLPPVAAGTIGRRAVGPRPELLASHSPPRGRGDLRDPHRLVRRHSRGLADRSGRGRDLRGGEPIRHHGNVRPPGGAAVGGAAAGRGVRPSGHRPGRPGAPAEHPMGDPVDLAGVSGDGDLRPGGAQPARDRSTRRRSRP